MDVADLAEVDDEWDIEGLHAEISSFWPTELTEEQLASTTTAAAPGAIEPELIVKPKKDEDGEAAPAEGGA